MTTSWRSATVRSRMTGDLPDETTQNATLAPPSPTPADGVQRTRPRLIAVAGAHVGSIHRIGDGVVLGRDPSATVCLDAPEVSRRHARIRASSEGFVLEDLGSRNGTYLNGRPIDQPTILADGDTVVLIKDLKLRGSSGVIKGGTKARNIRLVDGDHEIDCKIDGAQIGLKACYVKKA